MEPALRLISERLLITNKSLTKTKYNYKIKRHRCYPLGSGDLLVYMKNILRINLQYAQNNVIYLLETNAL